MKKIIVMTVCALSLLAHPIHAQERALPPQRSLFLTPQQQQDAEKLAQKSIPAGQGDISLGAVIYYAPNDWALWLQGEKWTPETTRQNLRVIAVTPHEVLLLWQAEDESGAREITLHPNESYQVSSGKIIATP